MKTVDIDFVIAQSQFKGILMAYVLVNPDNTVNYIGDELEEWLDLTDVVVNEIPNKTTAKIMGGIPPEFCVWDPIAKEVKDEREAPELVKPVNQFFDSEDEELEASAKAVRLRRNSALRATDARIAAADDPNLDIEAWKSYRQELRDIPSQSGFPKNVVWPTPPE